jgi:chaperonin GroEL
MKQKKQMFEDSLNSTRAAIEEGIVPGGGIALLRASRAVEKLKLQPEEMIGANSVLKACETPFKQIVMNSGFDSSVYLEKVIAEPETFGFNAQTEQIEDLQKSGIMDPLKVVKNSLKFAVSAAGIVLLSEALIGNAPEDNE